MNNAGKTRTDGMPVGIPFSSDNQPEGRGRPKGSISLSTRIRNLLEGDDLPEAIQALVAKYAGEGKTALDALLMSCVIKAFEDKAWAQMLLEHGWGKPEQTSKHEITGKNGKPLEVVQVYLPDNQRQG